LYDLTSLHQSLIVQQAVAAEVVVAALVTVADVEVDEAVDEVAVEDSVIEEDEVELVVVVVQAPTAVASVTSRARSRLLTKSSGMFEDCMLISTAAH
jgi:hypothetical protein